MGIIVRLVGVAFGLLVATMVGGLVAAARMKGNLVPRDDPEADEVALVAIFGPLAFTSRSQSFRGGTIDCWYGGGMIDLREARLAPEGAHLKVRAVFGGGQILVPDSWPVETHIVGLGGAGDTRSSSERTTEGPTLTIEGQALFGGFGIASDAPPEATRWMSDTRRKLGQTNGSDTTPHTETEPIPTN
jgi:hypothetical protein